MSVKPTGKRVEREAKLRWVPLADMQINPMAQRELNLGRVREIASNMELEQLGNPTLNFRDGLFFIIDGQHRVEAYKAWCGDGRWEGQSLQCWTYDGLTEEDEAEVFLRLNDVLTVAAFDKFRVGVRAGRVEETDIDRIVAAQRLRISRERGNGSIRAVGTLQKVYRLGSDTLARTLRLIRDAYGDAGLEAVVIEGFGLLCHRYNGELDEEPAVRKLSTVNGGLNGLLNAAEKLRLQTGNPRAHCVAAAAVDIYNRPPRDGRKKLQSWWREEF